MKTTPGHSTVWAFRTGEPGSSLPAFCGTAAASCRTAVVSTGARGSLLDRVWVVQPTLRSNVAAGKGTRNYLTDTINERRILCGLK